MRIKLSRLPLLFVGLLALPSASSAHVLDEYLQATLVAIEPGDIRLQMNLTPGEEIADKILAKIDRDRNGVISSDEGAAYADKVRSDLAVRLEGSEVELKLAASNIPALDELHTGHGIIQMEFSVQCGPLAAGAHRLVVHNRHCPLWSVYLFNAAKPKSALVQINKQNRNDNQSQGEIEFVYDPPAGSSRMTGWIASATALVGLAFAGVWWLRKSRLHSVWMQIILAAVAALTIAGACPSVFAADAPLPARFVFGQGGGDGIKPTIVSDSAVYSATSGWGFDLGTKQDAAGTPFCFSVGVPEGNYKVTVTLGGAAESTITVKAEARRLMLEHIHIDAGKTRTESFTVNVRRPQISTGGAVGLDSRENGSLNWDEKLTLAFSGDRVAIGQIVIEPAKVPTIFVLGDSTVTDQPSGSGGSWAQSLPRWFTADVAVANHAESGETLKAFRRPAERRWDKVLSQLQPGDWVFMQFGTNDMKMRGNNNIYPDEDFSSTYVPANTEFKELLKQYAGEAKEKGATAVMVSAMGRRSDSKTANSLGDYPKAALTAAKEFGCPSIDLNGMSIDVYLALGSNLVGRAFNDVTHPNNYGGYVLSRCIVEGIKQDKLDLAKYLRDDAGMFDPTHPAPLPDAFKPAADVRTGGGGRGGARQGGG